MMIKNEEKYNQISSYYFINKEYNTKLYNFVRDIIIELSFKGYDYKNNEMNDLIDKKVDDFVTDFNIHYMNK